MKVIGKRIVGESALEREVLCGFALMMLQELGGPKTETGTPGWWSIGTPPETGVMSAQAGWSRRSLDCEVWFETESDFDGSDPENFEGSEFLPLLLRWRTPEREGEWYEIESAMKGPKAKPSRLG